MGDYFQHKGYAGSVEYSAEGDCLYDIPATLGSFCLVMGRPDSHRTKSALLRSAHKNQDLTFSVMGAVQDLYQNKLFFAQLPFERLPHEADDVSDVF